MKRLSLTTGDSDGIGREIAYKALHQLGPVKDVQFILWKKMEDTQRLHHSLAERFKLVSVNNLSEALATEASDGTLIEITSSLEPALWVEQSAQAALANEIQGLVTGPLSKATPASRGGHTQILSRVANKKIHMLFAGSKFNVMLLTDHLPVSAVAENVTADGLEYALQLAYDFVSSTFPDSVDRPLALLGLNPHAGEEGALGSEEQRIFLPTINKFKERFLIKGPLVPDVAFRKENWAKYSLFLACYHDQGLIPFKMAHGYKEGAQISLGIPFVRTSVDHGTAKDIFGQNKAESGSMLAALYWAEKLISKEGTKS